MLQRTKAVVEKQEKKGTIETINLVSINEIINCNEELRVAQDGDIDYQRKITSYKDDFYTDFDLIAKNCGFIPGEKINDLVKASYQSDKKEKATGATLGVLVLTNFRLVFKFQNQDNETTFPEMYFSVPLFKIKEIKCDIGKVPEPYPIEVVLKDTRVLIFQIWDNPKQLFYVSLKFSIKPQERMKIFDFPKEYGKNVNNTSANGWGVCDLLKEFHRQGITENNDFNLRYCYANLDYSLCPTYPFLLVCHKDMTDEELKEASNYRTKNRLPALSFYYDGLKDVPNPSGPGLKSAPGIWRSSQCKAGITGGKRNAADQKVFDCLDLLADKVVIYDARPKLNALANRANGGGFEDVGNYTNTELVFCGIDNIHVARSALNKMFSLGLNTKINDRGAFWSTLEETGWYQFVYLVLKYSKKISETILNNHSALVHCSDGWDRTSQLTSLPQIMLDPYFRTIEGLAVLIEKDWLGFGHQFGLRNGIYLTNRKEDQDSPIFLQWLDCVHQLVHQFPNSFEYNEQLLLFLAQNINSNLYGSFMYNSEKERRDLRAKETASIWTDVLKNADKYKNQSYDKNSPKILSPKTEPVNLHYWNGFFMENNTRRDKKDFINLIGCPTETFLKKLSTAEEGK